MRVFSTYEDPSNSTGTDLTNAQVILSSGTNTWTAIDTLLQNPDTSLHQPPMRCYYVYPFAPQRLQTYSLRVTTGLGTSSAKVTIPGQAYLNLREGSGFFTNPSSYPLARITIEAVSVLSARGFLLRFLVEYEVLRDSTWIPDRAEIPVNYFPDVNPDVSAARYSIMEPVRATDFARTYFGYYFNAVVQQLSDRYSPKPLRTKNAIFELRLIDEKFYNYYNVVNGFRDQISGRTDKPDYSNVSGGYGLLGACTVDSLVIPL